MSHRDKIKRFFRKLNAGLSWTTVGVLLTAFGLLMGCWAVYLTYFYRPKPSLACEILTNAPIKDMREQLGDLTVLYKDQPLKEGKTISIIVLRFVNDGAVNIRESDYSSASPVGFRVRDAVMIDEPQIISARSDFFQKHFQLPPNDDLVSANETRFPAIVWDIEDYVDIKVIAIHDKADTPSIETFGKVAGMNQINVVESFRRLHGTGNINWLDRVRLTFFPAIAAALIAWICSLKRMAQYMKQSIENTKCATEGMQRMVQSYNQMFYAPMRTLDSRERELLKLHFGLGDGKRYTPEEIGHIFKTSPEEITKAVVEAIAKLSDAYLFMAQHVEATQKGVGNDSVDGSEALDSNADHKPDTDATESQ